MNSDKKTNLGFFEIVPAEDVLLNEMKRLHGGCLFKKRLKIKCIPGSIPPQSSIDK